MWRVLVRAEEGLGRLLLELIVSVEEGCQVSLLVSPLPKRKRKDARISK